MGQNILDYAVAETRSFVDFPLNDVDLLVLSAAMYLEFERFPAFLDPDESIPFADLGDFGTFEQYGEHDYYPEETIDLAAALATSKRFGHIPIEHFECVVTEDPAMQFGAACLPISRDTIVVAYRGTDITYEGWQEDFEMAWREASPGQEAALAYLHRAAKTYPDARLYVCGHSKGGGLAEYAVVFADDVLSGRIVRACSFDGPGLFRCGGEAAPDLAAYDVALSERYERVAVPLVRYIFPAAVGLLLEKRDPEAILGSERFFFVRPCGDVRSHGVFSVGVEGSSLVAEETDIGTVQKGLGSAHFLRNFSVEERAFASRTMADACRKAGIIISLSGEGMREILGALKAWYRGASGDERRAARSLIAKALKARARHHRGNTRG